LERSPDKSTEELQEQSIRILKEKEEAEGKKSD